MLRTICPHCNKNDRTSLITKGWYRCLRCKRIFQKKNGNRTPTR